MTVIAFGQYYTVFRTVNSSALFVVVVVVVVDSHIQRIVLETEETTVTQQVSHRPIKCQSRLWSHRGTKVNGSHHGDNPLLRPILIIMVLCCARFNDCIGFDFIV